MHYSTNTRYAYWCNDQNGPKVNKRCLSKIWLYAGIPVNAAILVVCEDQIREPDLPESHGSDNSSAAENQQERLIKIGWITGFVDGEGCFSIHIVRQPQRHNRRGYKTGFQVAHQFVVTQERKGH